MAGRRDDDEFRGTARDDVAVAQALGAVRRSERVDRRAGPGGQLGGAGGVVGVVVRQHDRPDVAGRRRNLAKVRPDRRPGIDHDRRPVADDPGVRPLQLADARVGTQHSDDAHRRQSCQKTDRGSRPSSSWSGSRVATRSAQSSSTVAHVASAVNVK
jgi:hypothetical protein